MLFFSLSATMWWLMIAVYLFIMMDVIPGLRQKSLIANDWHGISIEKVLYVVGWGVPAISTIIGLAARQIGFAGQYPW
jgi:hypothetical protein